MRERGIRGLTWLYHSSLLAVAAQMSELESVEYLGRGKMVSQK